MERLTRLMIRYRWAVVAVWLVVLLGGGYASTKLSGLPANTFTVPGRVLVDLGAHYDIQNWRLSLNLNNAFDREYISYCTTASVCYWGASRTVLGTARYQW